jgi:hypothetical protein
MTMDRLDYESEVIDILNEAYSELNSQEFETLLTRVEWILYYYK